jgi:hypothetical protein
MINRLTEAMLEGPAADLYRVLVSGVPMRDRWVAEIRELWGEKAHPSLHLFPEVTVSERTVFSRTATRCLIASTCWRERWRHCPVFSSGMAIGPKPGRRI